MLMMGEARVTSILAVSLSSVTVRGAEITLASACLFRNERAALTPSEFRKNVGGQTPRAVSRERPPLPSRVFSVVLEAGVVVTVRPPIVLSSGVPGVTVVPVVLPLPKDTWWLSKVPDQSMPLLVVGFIEVSSRRASI